MVRDEVFARDFARRGAMKKGSCDVRDDCDAVFSNRLTRARVETDNRNECHDRHKRHPKSWPVVLGFKWMPTNPLPVRSRLYLIPMVDRNCDPGITFSEALNA